jgi:hypothetical protein
MVTQHDLTVMVAKELARVHQRLIVVRSMWGTTSACAAAAVQSQRPLTPVLAFVRGTAMPTASCTHKPHCAVCFQCYTVLTKVLHCSRCKQAKYCNEACQTAHWSAHKKECVAPTASKK